MSQTLYDKDFQLWIDETIASLKNRDFDALDIEHLIEELADLGKSEKRELESNLVVLLAYLLKITVQKDVPNIMKTLWFESVNEHRQRVNQSIEDTPSLKSYLESAIFSAYQYAKKLAIKDSQNAKFGVRIPEKDEYPKNCPFSVEQILDEDFYGLDN